MHQDFFWEPGKGRHYFDDVVRLKNPISMAEGSNEIGPKGEMNQPICAFFANFTVFQWPCSAMEEHLESTRSRNHDCPAHRMAWHDLPV